MITPRIHTFPTPEPVELQVESPSGEVHVSATASGVSRVTLAGRRDDTATRQALEQATVEFADGRLRVVNDGRRWGRGASLRIEVTVPDGSSVRVRTASADTRIEGRVDSLDTSTASGDVTAEEVDGEARLNTASGDMHVRSVTGDVWARTASGDVRLGRAGALRVTTASGDVAVGVLGGSARVRTVSGDQQIGRAGQGELELNAVSGDVRVGVAEGTVAHLSLNTLSGTIRTDLPVEESTPDGGAALRVDVRTVSGDISVARASVAQPA